jgi:hypothetical protein
MRSGTVASSWADPCGFYFIEILDGLRCGKLVSGVEVWHSRHVFIPASVGSSFAHKGKADAAVPVTFLIFYLNRSRIRLPWISGNDV